ncbi:MAG: hypothetical protein GC154_07795 [bacterium]|nr:hypothetical protein [bacterium]
MIRMPDRMRFSTRRHGAAALFAAAFFLFSVMPAAARPVLVELFSSSACANCQGAEADVQRLKTDFSPDELNVVVYRPFDKDASSAIVTRARVVYGLKQTDLPVVFFNGLSRTPGWAPKIVYSTYRNNVSNLLKADNAESLSGWIDIAPATFTVSATYVASVSPVTPTLDLHFVVTGGIPSGPVDGATRMETLTPARHQVFQRGAALSPFTHQAYLILQDRVTKEVLASYRLPLREFVSADLNRDGLLNALDLFLFARYWRTGGTLADIMTDGVVDGLDLLKFIGPIAPF